VISVALPQLSRRFEQPDHYGPRDQTARTLPFRFIRLDGDRYVATNLAGEHIVLPRGAIVDLVNGTTRPDDPRYVDFLRKHFLIDTSSDVALDLLAVKYRTKQALLAQFTGLHIFVVTLRCDHACPYCQVSRVSSDKLAYDMTTQTADKAIDFLFRSPNPNLKVEFQGGESLLNFELIRYVVERVKERNVTEARNVEFVIATNLALITDDMLQFCLAHQIWISTSLDGPRALHNANRPRPGHDSYERTIEGIQRCRSVLGHGAVSALMTTTKKSLDKPEAIIDEYLARGFNSIFLRWLSPFGFASKTAGALGYSTDAWNRFYERGLRYIMKLNKGGCRIREEYARLVLRKILTPYATSYVDLQSPTGLGLSVVVYNYDGDIYASDESRMLAETGDRSFRLGNLEKDSYEDVFLSDRLLTVIDTTMTECTPCCADCAFEPYCGTDPVFHHATQGDMIGHRPSSGFCNRNMFLFKLLIQMLEDEPESAAILRSWAAA